MLLSLSLSLLYSFSLTLIFSGGVPLPLSLSLSLALSFSLSLYMSTLLLLSSSALSVTRLLSPVPVSSFLTSMTLLRSLSLSISLFVSLSLSLFFFYSLPSLSLSLSLSPPSVSVSLSLSIFLCLSLSLSLSRFLSKSRLIARMLRHLRGLSSSATSVGRLHWRRCHFLLSFPQRNEAHASIYVDNRGFFASWLCFCPATWDGAGLGVVLQTPCPAQSRNHFEQKILDNANCCNRSVTLVFTRDPSAESVDKGSRDHRKLLHS